MEQLPPGMIRTITLDFPVAMEHIRMAAALRHADFVYYLRQRCCAICKNELQQKFGTHTSLAWLHLYLLNTFWDALFNEDGMGTPSPWAQPAKTMRWDMKNGPNDELIDSQWVLETGRCCAKDDQLVQFLAEGTRSPLPGTSISLYVGPRLKARKRFSLPRVTTADDGYGRLPASPSPKSRSLADANWPPAAPNLETGRKRRPPSRLGRLCVLPPPPVFKLPDVARPKKRKATFDAYCDSSSLETAAGTSTIPTRDWKRARINDWLRTIPPRLSSTGELGGDGLTAGGR